MQNDCMNVNSGSILSAQEREVLLRAEIKATSMGMQDGLQQFADMRDRNIQAQFKLIALRAALRAGQGAGQGA